jgi:hypothetical protein
MRSPMRLLLEATDMTAQLIAGWPSEPKISALDATIRRFRMIKTASANRFRSAWKSPDGSEWRASDARPNSYARSA